MQEMCTYVVVGLLATAVPGLLPVMVGRLLGRVDS